MFEVRYTDLAGRIGRLSTAHGVVETPAFVPVVHPVRQAIKPSEIKKIGFDLLITNAYIARKRYGDGASSIHNIIDFDGAVMTDSGGYQVLEYGDLDASVSEIALFEQKIGSDIAIPLDKPTGFGLDRNTAESYVEQTLKNSKETIDLVNGSSSIWVGPIQGGEHLDLVSYSAKKLDELGYNMFALGSPVEVMESYEFELLARMIMAAKTSIPSSKPLHLFGAGHPLTIPLAVALGCDTFDSASYMLYARDDRYMLPTGTVKLQDLHYLPCRCGICAKYTASELLALPNDERFAEVARHNLHVIRREMDSVKQAIMEGRLWEYAMQKAMSHPKLMEAASVMRETSEYLEDGTPIYKERALLLFTPLDQYRPELTHFRRAVLQTTVNKDTLLLLREPDDHPFYASGRYLRLQDVVGVNVQMAYYSPFLGVVPAEVSDLFPAAHHLSARSKFDPSQFPTFASVLQSYIRKNDFRKIVIVADEFMQELLPSLALEADVTILEKDATREEIASALGKEV